MKQILLSTTDMCKSFANNGVQNHVLDMVNLDVYEGDFTIIMGSSGSGKSTLLYCLSGMDKATSGNVIYKEKIINSYNEKELSKLRINEFGFVFQQVHLISNLSLFENVAVTGYLDTNKNTNQAKTKALELLNNVNLTQAKDRLPAQVSGGEAQRAAIARAMINQPQLIFADEPTGALNRRNSQDVLNILSNINQQGQSILMVTHDIQAAIRANRLIYLDDGKIIDEIRLPNYHGADSKSRERQINAWLSSMEW